ncbi:cytochrome P450 [Streptomyces bauhiniae]|uniref:cytochrome P450 n=1 Tax=Streptomyces bauhiniae TaxID=2340725 RepID=UPI0035D9B8FA
MASLAPTAEPVRSLVFDQRIKDLLARDEKVFRIDATTVGVSDADLIASVVAARPVLSTERSVFKPAGGADISHSSATRTIRALGKDVTAGMDTPAPAGQKLSGAWPHAGVAYLREWLFTSDSLPVSMLSHPGVMRSDILSRIADNITALWPANAPGETGSALSAGILQASSTLDRRQGAALYRRAISVLCDGVSALATNALWLMAAHHREDETDLKAVLWETLRLLPPAWMLWRTGGGEYTPLDGRIGPGDNIALFPLLMHCDPQYWSSPLEFRPERWSTVADPEAEAGYMPFGFDGAHCWARHLILPLAERLLTEVLANRLTVSPAQREAHVPLRSLLSVRIDMVAAV